MKNKNVQPAKVSYFFDKGYRDLWATIKGAWRRNIESTGKEWRKARDYGIFSFEGGMHTISALCICIFGSVLTLATTLIHIGVLGIILVIIYLSFSIVWLIDRIYIAISKIRNACPHSSCQAHFLLPIYECPDCHVHHTHLVPSKYGILKRRCECTNKLPTTFLNGRGKLTAYCPECNQELTGDTASRQYALPVIGGPSVGKSCLINMAVDKMITGIAPTNNWEIDFLTENNKRDFELARSYFREGKRLLKTELDALTAYQLMIKLPAESIGRRTYIYDISGEMFSSSGDIQRNNAYSYADGFIFLIDPLTIGRFAEEVEGKIDITSYGASSKDFEDILNIMLINLEKMFNLKPKDVLKKNLAVVINKCDIPGVEERLGYEAVKTYMIENSECGDIWETRNMLCKQFLEEYNSGNFVRTVEKKFKKVQYFTCSALGHNFEGQAYEGKYVEEPFLWLLGEIDNSMRIAANA